MTAKRKIFDAHHHLWALGACRYPWLMARGERRFFGDPTPIQRDYLAEEFLSDAADYELIGSAHIQVGTDEDDAVLETRWLQEVSELHECVPSGIVGFADLRRPDLDQLLSAHAASTAFRGVRQIIGRHPSEDGKTGSATLLDDPRFLRGLKLLERRNLTFDLQLTENQYWGALRLFRHAPDLKAVLCHFASPWDLSKDGFERWRGAMRAFAEFPQMSIKLSGFGMFKPDWALEDVKPYVDAALELFGPKRCMTGSNFPVDKLYGDYGRIWRAVEALITDQRTRDRVMFENAMEFYSAPLAESRSNSALNARAPSRMNA
jgi:predicted TIM-barrel fold metal-dependent hydrolase